MHTVVVDKAAIKRVEINQRSTARFARMYHDPGMHA